MLRIAVIAAALAVSTFNVFAADLDAPLKDRPTVRSEIARGHKAAFHCFLVNKPVTERVEQCVLNLAAAEEQRHVDYKPFEVGIFYGTCVYLAVQIDTDIALRARNRFAAANLPLGRTSLAAMYKIFRQKQAELGLSDEQVVEGTDMPAKAKKPALLQLRRWAKEMPQSRTGR